MAAITTGMSGADIYSISNEAAILAARKNKDCVEMSDFREAYDRIITGLKRNLPLTSTHKKTIAYHEAGHAVVSWYLKHASPLLKVTIIPRAKGALGFSLFMPEEIELFSREQLYDMLCMTYGGRAAEEMILGTITTGAQDDLAKATMLSKAIIGKFGMSKEFPNVSLIEDTMQVGIDKKAFQGASFAKIYDKAVLDLCHEAYERAKKVLTDNKARLESLAKLLLEKETVEIESLKEVLGPRECSEPEKVAAYENVMKGK